ncbi:unnamed protein product [Diabrotica balteata]|uniref:Zinc finger protein 865 n=1 Tax=Diabrotica balteata TaxID=107213 RepID=A0A9N9XAS2_DIABA|nr:unnamed protein product [Diabrotica balteata]
MLTSNVNSVSEETDWPTFFIIPFDACGQVKVLPDGSIYLITNENQQNEDRTNEAILNSLESNSAYQPETTKVIKTQPQFNQLEEIPAPVVQNNKIDSPYSCPDCQATFSTPKEHSDHLKWHKKFKCTNCPATYNIETNLKIHFELVHQTENTLRNCPICGIALRFKRAASLKSHMMIHQVEEVYTCQECEAEFEKENEYSQHVISHYSKKEEPEAPLSCPQCILQFETKEELKLHKANHTKAWKYFKRKRTKQKVSVKKDNYTCDICKKGFIKKSLLERHERIHSGEKPFECNICQQTFGQKVTLENHLLKHTGRKPFACFLCPARFNQKGNLRVHINKTHTAPQNGQKVFKCSQCSCMFKRIASLNGHVTKAHLTVESAEDGVVNDVMKNLKDLKTTNFESSVTLTESGSEKKYSVKLKKIGDTKWYKCTYCSKLCKKPSDLIRHIRIHTKERPFECKLCPATFTSKSAVHNHKKLHFGKKFKCDVCDSVLDSNMEYLNHLHKGECGKLLLKESPDQAESVINKVPKQTDKTGSDVVPEISAPNTSEAAVAKPFHCTMCSARFIKKTNLHKHFQTHEGEKFYKCPSCSKVFMSMHQLKEHTSQHTNNKKYHCKICSKKFPTVARFRRHMAHHAVTKTLKCPYCPRIFPNVELTKIHLKIFHKKGLIVEESEPANDIHEPTAITTAISKSESVEDEQCENAVATEVINIDNAEPIGDAQINADFQTFSVNLEDIQLLNNGVFSTLVENVTVPENFQLAPASTVIEPNQTNEVLLYNAPPQPLENVPETAEDVYDNTGTIFQLTENINDNKNMYKGASILCMSCNQVFTNYSLFQQHACRDNFNDKTAVALTEDEIEARIQEIEQTLGILQDGNTCSKDPRQPQDLDRIEPCKIFQCPACNKAFKSRLAFKKHIKMHSCWECYKCKKVLIGKNAYLEHVQSHKDSKMFPCLYCKKLFKKPSDLERHHRIHTGEKPFECTICHKKFTLRATLKSHLRTHDPQQKQYPCDVCDVLYSSKTSLKMHMTLHTGVLHYKCPVCKAEFRTPSAKRAHMAMGHKTAHNSKTKRRNKIANILRSASNKLVPQSVEEIQEEVHEYVTYEDMPVEIDQGQILTQTETLDLTSQMTNLNLPAGAILSTIQEGDITVDPSLLQQFQMTDVVLTNPEPEPGSSIIIDDVSSFLNLNPTTNNIQIVSMPENDEGGVTISIKEETEITPKKVKSEKSKLAVQCDLCLRLLASKDGLRKHKKNVHGHKRKHSCFKCDDKFDTKEQLAVHEKIHLAALPCPICSLAFENEAILEEHLYSVHGIAKSNEETLSLFNLKLASMDDPLLNKYGVTYFN